MPWAMFVKDLTLLIPPIGQQPTNITPKAKLWNLVPLSLTRRNFQGMPFFPSQQ